MHETVLPLIFVMDIAENATVEASTRTVFEQYGTYIVSKSEGDNRTSLERLYDSKTHEVQSVGRIGCK